MTTKRKGRRMRWISIICLLISVLFVSRIAWTAEPPQKKAVADFYKGAIVKIIIPSAPGGGQDTRMRALESFFEKHSGAQLVIQNMPGAGGYVALNYLYHTAKPDGLNLCTFFGSGVFMAEELGQKEATWKLEKLSFIARVTRNWGGPLMVGRKSPIRTLDDLVKAKREIKCSVTDPTVPGAMHLTLIAEALGLNFKIISGFEGGKACVLAAMRGEVELTSNPAAGLEDAFKKGDLIPLAMIGEGIPPSLPPNLPSLTSLPLSKDKKRFMDLSIGLSDFGNVIAGPPGIPQDRMGFLENAMMRALNEPELKKFFEIRGDNYAPLSGSEYLKILRESKKLVSDIGIKELENILFKKYY